MDEYATNPPPVSAPGDAKAMLIEFIRDRDTPCPRCGYNLRNLTTAICPECQEPLMLTVGAERFSLVALIITLTPSMFMAGLTVFMTLVLMGSGGGGGVPAAFCLFWVFGLASGGSALILAANARRFLRLKPSAQTGWAVLTWAVHFFVFVLAIAAMSF